MPSRCGGCTVDGCHRRVAVVVVPVGAPSSAVVPCCHRHHMAEVVVGAPCHRVTAVVVVGAPRHCVTAVVVGTPRRHIMAVVVVMLQWWWVHLVVTSWQWWW
jgi:hypothetical protein